MNTNLYDDAQRWLCRIRWAERALNDAKLSLAMKSPLNITLGDLQTAELAIGEAQEWLRGTNDAKQPLNNWELLRELDLLILGLAPGLIDSPRGQELKAKRKEIRTLLADCALCMGTGWASDSIEDESRHPCRDCQGTGAAMPVESEAAHA